jgi:hypothetical protein
MKSLLNAAAGLVTLFLAAGHSLHAEEESFRGNPGGGGELSPPLKWKYGYKDGGLNNTIGSVRGHNPAPAALAPPSTGYGPAQIAAAYRFNQISATGDGRGQTIAIVVAYGSPNIQNDLNSFCSAYGIPTTTVSIYYPQGRPSVVNVGWA